VLPLQQQQKALDLKLFHTLPTARIWCCLTSSCSELSRHISKAIVSHMMQKFQAAMAKWFQEQPEKFYTDRFEKLVQSWQRCIE
jgi:hypothetical protein